MNLNEVKKHVYFNLAIYIGLGICFIISLIAILITPVKAQEVSVNFTNSIYPGYVNNYGCNSGTTGQYCAINTGGNVNSRSFNTRYNGVLQSIEFESNFYFRNNTTYTFDIYANSNDFRNNNVTAYCYSYDNYPSQSVSIGCSYRFISKTHIQVVYPYNSYSHHFIQIVGNQVTGDTNYSLKSVYLSYDDGTQDFSGVIDNATNNTTDIINNNNSNTQDTISAIDVVGNTLNSLVGNLCPNRANWPNGEQNKIVINATHDDSVVATGQTINLTAGVKYYFSYERSCVGDCVSQSPYDIFLLYNGGYAYFINNQHSGFQFIPEYSGSYELRVDCNINGDTCSYWNFYVGTVGHNYCPYGSYLSKLDDTNEQLGGIYGGLQETNDKVNDIIDQQQNQYDFLTDDSNPSVNTTGINDVMSSVEITDPLNYLLTLPISLLTKLNQVLSANSCSRVSFGTLYNTELYLPCINFEQILGSTIWGTIDLIVGVGLLAIIFKRFYDSISNVLTLGKEKEVRDKLDLPTPMQFLASILGGGRD